MAKPNTTLPSLLKHTGRLIDNQIDSLLKQHAIARSQYRVLYYVSRQPGLTQKELIDMLQVQGSTLTLIVDTLVQKGWLIRTPDSLDRRIKKLSLTSEGQKNFKHIPDPNLEINKRLVSFLSKSEQQDLTLSLEKIIKHLS